MKRKYGIFIVVCFVFLGCSATKSKYKREVDLDTIKIIPASQKWATFEELNLNGLTIGDVEKLYGKRKCLYWGTLTFENEDDVPFGYEDFFPIKEYPADMISYSWVRSSSDSIYMTIYFVIDGNDTIAIEGEQLPYDAWHE